VSAGWREVVAAGLCRVKKDMCATCIFRPGNLMNLTPGRVKGMVAEAEYEDSFITCHETLEAWTGTQQTEAMCRGYLNAGHRPVLLRLAEEWGLVVEV
jgi:hypothetical protein